MDGARFLGSRLLARSAPRPRARSAPAGRVAQTAVRRKSGPYGYTQAKALVYSKHGQPSDVLGLHTHSISPSLPPSSVLVRTLAAPINPADVNTIQGTYGSKQPFTSLIGTAEPSAVPGNEAVFEVVSVGGGGGSDATAAALRPGDWVLPAAPQMGTWRTHAVVGADELLRIDKSGLTAEQAALVSVNPCTAYRILRSYGPGAPPSASASAAGLPMRPLDPGSGQWFIQNGANSGVGRAAIQFGRLWGLRSINVVRERDSPEATEALRGELRALGADVVVTDAETHEAAWPDRLAELTRGGRDRIGLGLNCVGGRSAAALARCLAEGGTLVSYGNMSRKAVHLPLGALIFRDVRLVGFWLSRWNGADPTGRRHMIDDILALVRAGRFRDAPVDEVRWEWDTPEAALRDAAQNGLGGFRKGKGLFLFGDT